MKPFASKNMKNFMFLCDFTILLLFAVFVHITAQNRRDAQKSTTRIDQDCSFGVERFSLRRWECLSAQDFAANININLKFIKGAHKDMFTDLLTPPSGSDPKTYLPTEGGWAPKLISGVLLRLQNMH